MYKSKLRLLGVSALVGAGLIAAPQEASAYEVRLGTFDVKVDNTMSVGLSVRVADRDLNFVAEGNGSIRRPTKRLFNGVTFDGTESNVPETCVSFAAICMPVDSTLGPVLGVAGGDPDNFDTSINGDDSRLNFDNGDLTGGTLKLTSDIEALSGPFRVFARLNAFYDPILMDEDSYERSGLNDDGEEEVGANLKLLDMFVDYEGMAAGIPFLVRAGKQVINWGESTFVGGGNSTFNAIDVPAFRRPGAEVKEALIPIEALYVSASLTDNLSLEAYAGGWDSFIIDPSGTPFSGSDSVPGGSGKGGNENLFFVGGGARSGSNNVNWNETFLAQANAVGDAGNNLAALMIGNTELIDQIQASDSPWKDRTTAHGSYYLNDAPEGEVESFRLEYGDTNYGLVSDREPDGEESYGLALRYYAENLNSTEFGFYYQSYTSRIPYAGFRAKTPQIGLETVSETAGVTTRALHGSAACVTTDWGRTDKFAHTAALTDAVVSGITIGEGEDITDPNGIWPSIKAAAQEAHDEMFDDAVGYLLWNPTTANVGEMLTSADTKIVFADRMSTAAASVSATNGTPAKGAYLLGADTIGNLKDGWKEKLEDDGWVDGNGDPIAYNGTAVFDGSGTFDISSPNAASGNFAYLESGAYATLGTFLTLTGYDGDFGDDDNTYKSLVDAHCILGINGRILDANDDGDPFGNYGATGAMRPAVNYQTDLFTYYPEEIEVYGISAATTLFGWGVQGEVAFRPDFPLQIDTDTLFISTASLQCAFPLYGNTGTNTYGILQTQHENFCDSTVGQQDVFGDAPADVINWDIGTTATFTRSNPVVSALGADLGVLLTEFAGVIADGIEDEYYADPDMSGADGVTRLASICTAGSDIGLKALLGIDAVDTNSCRPTESSSGAVLFASLQYNNVFGTPLSVSPALIHRTGLSGFSPRPAGSWREGVHSTALRVNASYLGQWNFGLSYIDYAGDTDYTNNIDKDTMSITASYAF